MALSEKEMGEIALKIVKQQVRDVGIQLDINLDEESANLATRHNIKKEDAHEFIMQIGHELFAERYGPPPQ